MLCNTTEQLGKKGYKYSTLLLYITFFASCWVLSIYNVFSHNASGNGKPVELSNGIQNAFTVKGMAKITSILSALLLTLSL